MHQDFEFDSMYTYIQVVQYIQRRGYMYIIMLYLQNEITYRHWYSYLFLYVLVLCSVLCQLIFNFPLFDCTAIFRFEMQYRIIYSSIYVSTSKRYYCRRLCRCHYCCCCCWLVLLLLLLLLSFNTIATQNAALFLASRWL